MHWISPNPHNVDVFGEKGKGTSAALKRARNDTGEIVCRWKKTEWKKKVKQRRELKGQGNLLSEEYRKEK